MYGAILQYYDRNPIPMIKGPTSRIRDPIRMIRDPTHRIIKKPYL